MQFPAWQFMSILYDIDVDGVREIQQTDIILADRITKSRCEGRVINQQEPSSTASFFRRCFMPNGQEFTMTNCG
jgi:hypothetical protein